jgi:hypothetical protein
MQDDDEHTPTQEPGPPLSGTAINLLDLALAVESVAVNLRELARQYDSSTGEARKHLCRGSGDHLIEKGGLLVEAGIALNEEGDRDV